jgi:hypothetical protein
VSCAQTTDFRHKDISFKSQLPSPPPLNISPVQRPSHPQFTARPQLLLVQTSPGCPSTAPWEPEPLEAPWEKLNQVVSWNLLITQTGYSHKFQQLYPTPPPGWDMHTCSASQVLQGLRTRYPCPPHNQIGVVIQNNCICDVTLYYYAAFLYANR